MIQKENENMNSTPENKSVALPYTPTAAEEALCLQHQSQKTDGKRIRLKIQKTRRKTAVSVDHPDERVGSALMMAALGTSNPAFSSGIIKQVVNHTQPTDEASLSKANFLLAMAQGIEPRDEVEAMLAMQMAVVHDATMTLARRLASSGNILQQDSTERAFNKLARTYTSQMDALKRYRSDGRQTVRVERVTVEAGGQAVVGAVGLPARGGMAGLGR